MGRVAEAERDIATALKGNSKEGTALALRAVIAVVRNETDEALRFAQEAVAAEPGRNVSTTLRHELRGV